VDDSSSKMKIQNLGIEACQQNCESVQGTTDGEVQVFHSKSVIRGGAADNNNVRLINISPILNDFTCDVKDIQLDIKSESDSEAEMPKETKSGEILESKPTFSVNEPLDERKLNCENVEVINLDTVSLKDNQQTHDNSDDNNDSPPNKGQSINIKKDLKLHESYLQPERDERPMSSSPSRLSPLLIPGQLQTISENHISSPEDSVFGFPETNGLVPSPSDSPKSTPSPSVLSRRKFSEGSSPRIPRYPRLLSKPSTSIDSSGETNSEDGEDDDSSVEERLILKSCLARPRRSLDSQMFLMAAEQSHHNRPRFNTTPILEPGSPNLKTIDEIPQRPSRKSISWAEDLETVHEFEKIKQRRLSLLNLLRKT